MILGPKVFYKKPIEKEIQVLRSNVILLKGILSEELLGLPNEEFKEIEEDIKDKAKLFGTLVSCLFPREKDGFSKEVCGNVVLISLKNLSNKKQVYLEYSKEEEGKTALENFKGKKYNGSVGVVSFYSPLDYFDLV